MEFLLELFFTAAISIVFAFLLAKLISIASASGLDQDLAQRFISSVEPSQFPLSAENIGATSIQELKCEEETWKRQTVGVMLMKGDESEMNFDGQDAETLPEIYGEKLKEEADAVRVSERDGVEMGERSSDDVESCGGLVTREIGVESAVKECLGAANGVSLAKPSEIDLKEVKRENTSEEDAGFDVRSVKEEVRMNTKEEKKSGEIDVRSVKEESKLNEDEFEEKENKKSESDGGLDAGSVEDEVRANKDEKDSGSVGEFDAGLLEEESRSSKVGFDTLQFDPSDGDFMEEENVVEKGRGDEKGSLLDDDDEWEGIEKSELEKHFGAMASRVASGSGELLSKIGSDAQMQLYGLHKVATEGPCYEPQPSVLKVAARAKWHAWQRLGNMNPEVAMEQYINLLSVSIPGWIGEKAEDNRSKEEENDSLKEPACGSEVPDLVSSLQHLTSHGNERKPEEVHSCVAEIDDINGQKFIEQGHSVKDAA